MCIVTYLAWFQYHILQMTKSSCYVTGRFSSSCSVFYNLPMCVDYPVPRQQCLKMMSGQTTYLKGNHPVMHCVLIEVHPSWICSCAFVLLLPMTIDPDFSLVPDYTPA